MTSDTLTVALGDRTYDIFFGEDIYSLFQDWICRFYPGGAVFVVTDENVASIYGENVRRWLAGIPHRIHSVTPGETSKNLATVSEIYAFLAGGGADRESLVVAFGGGVVGDLAGFAAATYLRGIPYIQVPTTLLSQVDSSVGGKTGFNLPAGKNLVGAFHQPRAVFIDHTFLRTLDERNLKAGMAEVVKCAVAGDVVLWELLRSHAGRWRSMSGEAWHEVIRRSIAYKASVVEKDERESSTRKILNLGHTVGHAMEQAAGYSGILHGEAVAMGLAWETVFSRRLGVTPPELEAELLALLRAMGFSLDEPVLALSSIASAVGRDKKRVVSDVEMPMATAAGSCILRRVPLSLLRRELPEIRAEIRRKAEEAVMDSEEERKLLERIEQGEARAVAASLAQRIASHPRELRTLVLLSRAYLRAGETASAWETIKEALHQHPSDEKAQRAAREIERELLHAPSAGDGAPSIPLEDVVLLDGEAFEIRPADLPEGPPIAVEPLPEAPSAASVPTEAPPLAEEFPAGAVDTGSEPETPPQVLVVTEQEVPPPAAEAQPEEPAVAPVPTALPEPAPPEPLPPETVVVAEAPPPSVPAEEPPAATPFRAPVKRLPQRVETKPSPAAGPTSPVRTITMANVCWEQGEREIALRIVDEILQRDPGDERAIEWKRTHTKGELEELLEEFLSAIAKEYRYDLSKPH
jgi:3-dehydroquinate synthase